MLQILHYNCTKVNPATGNGFTIVVRVITVELQPTAEVTVRDAVNVFDVAYKCFDFAIYWY